MGRPFITNYLRQCQDNRGFEGVSATLVLHTGNCGKSRDRGDSSYALESDSGGVAAAQIILQLCGSHGHFRKARKTCSRKKGTLNAHCRLLARQATM